MPPADCHDTSCRNAAVSRPLKDPPPLVCKCLPSCWPLVCQLVVVSPLLSRCRRLSSSQHATSASCPLTHCLCLETSHRHLSAGASPLICLSFTGWFPYIISSRRRLKCPSLTPAFIHTGWLLHLISSRCFCLLSSHQHCRLLMRWQLTSCLPLVCPNWLPVCLTWYAQ